MMSDKPKTSTPNPFARVSSRKSIHDKDISPVPKEDGLQHGSPKRKLRKYARNKSPSVPKHRDHSRERLSSQSYSEGDTEEEYDEENEENEYTEQLPEPYPKPLSESKALPEPKPKEEANINSTILLTILGILSIAVFFAFAFNFSNNPTANNIKYSAADFSRDFPNQHTDFWFSIDSGVEDAKALGRPATFVVLYKSSHEHVVQDILDKISTFATCKLTSCTDPLVLNSNELNLHGDYGDIIAKYREPLEQTGVMIVKNLEQLQYKPAQAFHSICDQYAPLVANSIVVFTMKVDKFVPYKMLTQHLENLLRLQWDKMPDEVFYALYTRISNVIFNIN